MEFLLVTFRDDDREVLIDGVSAGLCNHLITIAPGTYTIALAPPDDFAPAEITVVVEDTSPTDPFEVAFA